MSTTRLTLVTSFTKSERIQWILYTPIDVLVGGEHSYSSHGMRLFLQILLLVTFLHFFGLPAIEKYQKKEVIVIDTTKDTEGIPLPAITLFFSNGAPETQMYRSCYNLNVSIVDCLEANTPNVSKLLKKVVFGYEKKKTLDLKENEITGNVATLRDGGYIFTLRFPLKIGPDDDETQIFLFLAHLIFIISFGNLTPKSVKNLQQKFSRNKAS